MKSVLQPKKHHQVAQEAVHGTEKPKVDIDPVEVIKTPETAKWDTTIYHEDHEPRNVKTGEIIPEGWTTEPGTLSVLWKNNPDGSYFKIKKG